VTVFCLENKQELFSVLSC